MERDGITGRGLAAIGADTEISRATP
jgi:hypothetical protein